MGNTILAQRHGLAAYVLHCSGLPLINTTTERDIVTVHFVYSLLCVVGVKEIRCRTTTRRQITPQAMAGDGIRNRIVFTTWQRLTYCWFEQDRSNDNSDVSAVSIALLKWRTIGPVVLWHLTAGTLYWLLRNYVCGN